MLIYCSKSIVLLGLFYLLYSLFLKHERLFTWSRFYIIIVTLISFLLPLINCSNLIKTPDNLHLTPTSSLNIILNSVTVLSNSFHQNEIKLEQIILYVYFMGVLIGLSRLLYGFWEIRSIKSTSQHHVFNSIPYYLNASIECPFSFQNSIFIPNSFNNSKILFPILLHEQAHIKFKHSREKIFFSLLQAFAWFNPFVFLFHKEIELVHEYEADAISTKQIPKEEYVNTLLESVIFKQTNILLTHQFFNHPLKSRIIMLYKKSKNAIAQKSGLVFSSVILCMFTLFSQSYGQQNETKLSYKIQQEVYDSVTVVDPITGKERILVVHTNADTIYNNTEEPARFYGGNNELSLYLTEHLNYPELARKQNVEGKIFVQFIISNTGKIDEVKILPTAKSQITTAYTLLENEALRVVKEMPNWRPGKVNHKPVNTEFVLPINFKLGK